MQILLLVEHLYLRFKSVFWVNVAKIGINAAFAVPQPIAKRLEQ